MGIDLIRNVNDVGALAVMARVLRLQGMKFRIAALFAVLLGCATGHARQSAR